MRGVEAGEGELTPTAVQTTVGVAFVRHRDARASPCLPFRIERQRKSLSGCYDEAGNETESTPGRRGWSSGRVKWKTLEKQRREGLIG